MTGPEATYRKLLKRMKIFKVKHKRCHRYWWINIPEELHYKVEGDTCVRYGPFTERSDAIETRERVAKNVAEFYPKRNDKDQD